MLGPKELYVQLAREYLESNPSFLKDVQNNQRIALKAAFPGTLTGLRWLRPELPSVPVVFIECFPVKEDLVKPSVTHLTIQNPGIIF